MNYSSTQLANIGVAAGVITIILSKLGVNTSTETVAFILGAVLSLGSAAYSYYNRFKKGDLTLLGGRK